MFSGQVRLKNIFTKFTCKYIEYRAWGTICIHIKG